MFSGSVIWRGFVYSLLMCIGKIFTGLWLIRIKFNLPKPKIITQIRNILSIPQKSKPTLLNSQNLNSISLYPGAIVGTAMVARGEIGFLIATTAQTIGILGPEFSLLYLTIIWAIVLCTIFGPVCTGILVRRVKRLQNQERTDRREEKPDPLGIWGLG
jgi:Kef-type K+ transport system membrane component KefB